MSKPPQQESVVGGIMGMLGGNPGVGTGGGGVNTGQPQSIQGGSFEAFLRSLGVDPATIPPEMLNSLRQMWMQEQLGKRQEDQARRDALRMPAGYTNVGARGRG